MSSKLSGIDYSKRKKGMSKREYAAKVTGGKLNYKTGKITVKKSSSKKSSSKSWDSSKESAADYAIRTGTDPSLESEMGDIASPEYEEYYISSGKKGMSGEESSKRNNAYNKNRSADTRTSVAFNNLAKKAQRTNAAKAYSLRPTTTRNNTAGNIFKGITEELQATSPIIGSIGKGLKTFGVDLSNILGIDKALTSDSGLAQLVGENGQVLGARDSMNIINSENGVTEPTPSPYLSWDTFNQSYGNDSNNRTDTRKSSNGQTPSRTSIGPTAPVISSALSDAYQTGLPDNTPIASENATVNRIPGKGIFSTGQFGNGSGDYGLSGAMGSVDNGLTIGEMNSPMDELMIALGLKTPTAQTQETPNQMQPQYSMDYIRQNTSPAFPSQYSTFENGVGRWNDVAPSNKTASVGNPNIQSNPTYQSQPAANTGMQDPSIDYAQQSVKGYDKQMKAQKKALKTLLKSIEKQYKQSETEGKTDLEKSKQEDLLKLSGLFGFANSAPNDEQRIQYQTRTTNDYASQLKNFLSKLAASKSTDLLNAQNNYQSQIAAIEEAKSKAQQNVAQLLYQAQQDALDRQSKGSKVSWTPAFDDNGNIIGTYHTDNSGNIFYNPSDTPIKAKSKTQNIWDQLNLNGLG